VIDVVAAEAGAHQFSGTGRLLRWNLSHFQTRLAHADRLTADAREPGGRTVKRLVPRRDAEVRPRTLWIDDVIGILADTIKTYERLLQPVRMVI